MAGYEDAASTKLLAQACIFCGRPLRDPESIERGYGPDCADKYWRPHGEPPESLDVQVVQEAMRMAPDPLKTRWRELGGDPEDTHAPWATSPFVRKSMLSVGLHHGALAVTYGGDQLKLVSERVDAALLVIAAVQNFALGAGYDHTAEQMQKRYTERLKGQLIIFERDKQKPSVMGVHTPRSDQWTRVGRENRDVFFRFEKKGWLFFRYFHEAHLGRVVNLLQSVFGDQLAVMEDGRLVALPSMALPEPVPVTPPAGPPTKQTGELPHIPPEVDVIRIGSKVKLADGTTSTVWWLDPAKGRIGVAPTKREKYTWLSLTQVKSESGKTVAAGIDAERRASDKIEGAPPEVRVPVKLPRELPVGLMPHQIENIAFAEAHHRVLIADVMGLGKTASAIAVMDLPAIVVPPSHLKVNWVREIAMWRPKLKTTMLEGLDTPSIAQMAADVVIVNYDILHAHVEWLTRFGAKSLTADEAHYLKNLEARWNKASGKHEVTEGSPRRARAFYELQLGIPQLLLLTGTPLMNRTRELWPLLHMMNSQEWSSGHAFCVRYCGGHEKQLGRRKVFDCNGSTNRQELHERIVKRYMIRHTKEEVLKDLPPKRRSTQVVSMDPKWRKHYAWIVKDFLSWVQANGGVERVMRAMRAQAIVKLTAMRSVAARGKVPAAFDWILSHIESTGRPLVFMAVHKKAIEDLVALIEKSNAQWHETMARGGTPDTSKPIRYAAVYGGVTKKQAQKAIDDFQEKGTLDLLIYSIPMATGTTLTRAQEVTFLERLWRPADQVQSEDRLHRIGQLNAVQVTYLDAEGTIDRKLAMLLMDKATTAYGVIDGIDLSRDAASQLVMGEMFDVKDGFIESLGELLEESELAFVDNEIEEPESEDEPRGEPGDLQENPATSNVVPRDSWDQPI